jgi:non-specific serine/threonine protein kinase
LAGGGNGKPGRAEQLLRDGLQLTQLVDNPRQAAACPEALAWIAGAIHDPRRAVVLMAAAETVGRTVGASTVVLPYLQVFHDDCQHKAREALAADEFAAAQLEGCSLSFDEAVGYALGETTWRNSTTSNATRSPPGCPPESWQPATTRSSGATRTR